MIAKGASFYGVSFAQLSKVWILQEVTSFRMQL
jgi:hypothetical protein